MLKGNKKHILIVSSLFITLVLIQHFGPKPIDWRIDMFKTKKTPYGCIVLADMMNELGKGNVQENFHSLYMNPIFEESQNLGNLLIVSPSFFPDPIEIDALFSYLNKGNDVFISAHTISRPLLDSFDIRIKSPLLDSSYFKRSTDVFNFYNPKLKKDSGFVFNRKLSQSAFIIEDSSRVTLLGHDLYKNPNFISLKYGKGKLILHSQPLVFTNIHILYGSSDYALRALSYLSNRPLVIDRYYNPYRAKTSSPTQYLLSELPLRIAFYILLLTLVLYLVFGSKRKQGVIQVMEPKVNTSLEFIHTVGKLYFNGKNHTDIAHKKAIYFKEFLRNHYYISKVDNSEEELKHISFKSGVNLKLTTKTIRKLLYYEKQTFVSEMALLEFNETINDFYKSCK